MSDELDKFKEEIDATEKRFLDQVVAGKIIEKDMPTMIFTLQFEHIRKNIRLHRVVVKTINKASLVSNIAFGVGMLSLVASLVSLYISSKSLISIPPC